MERSAEVTNPLIQDGEHHYHHKHYYLNQAQPFHQFDETLTNGLLQRRTDIPYKLRVGEVLAKDSTLYNRKTPTAISRSTLKIPLRRNYWPTVDNTVTSLASKAAAGANAVSNLFKIGFFHTIDNVNAAVEHKRHKIASYLIQAAQDHKIALAQAQENEKHQQQLKLAAAAASGNNQQIPLTFNQPQQQSQGSLLGNQLTSFNPLNPLSKIIPLKQKLTQNVVQHIVNKIKNPFIRKPLGPPTIVYSTKSKTLPSTTISDGYMHTYDNGYIPPKFVNGPGRNPYADMGVTSYKHFEDTILNELEEKEERKVEATMHTLYEDKYLFNENLEGTRPASTLQNEWTPLSSNEDNQITLFSTPKSLLDNSNYIQSTFDRPFTDVRPVCEQLDELAIQPTLYGFPAAAESQVNEQQDASNENVVIHKLNDTNKNETTTDKPNYPAYFIKQQQQLKKLQQKLLRAHQLKNQQMNKTQMMNNSNSNKSHQTRSRGNYRAGISSTSNPSTTTVPSSLLFYPSNSNNSDNNGFRPMLPSEIKSMKIHHPIRIKLNSTVTTPSIQAQASHVQLSIVSAPTSSSRVNKHNTSYSRKSPKKLKETVNASKANNTTSSYTKSNQKMNRGSIKFSDSVRQSR